NSKKRVSRSLIELAVQNSAILYFELKQRVAWRQIDVVSLSWIPTSHNQTSGIRIGTYLFNESGNLIDAIFHRVVTSERTPEITINWSQISSLPAELPRVIFISPFRPDVDPTRTQISLIGISGKKPEQFLGDPTKRNFLGRNDRKSFAQIESRLITKMGNRSNTGPIRVLCPILQNRSQQFVILIHLSDRITG